MSDKERWNERYSGGKLTWDIGIHDFNLETVVINTPITPCKALEIGSGTGDNSLWLAQRGFQVTGVDIAEQAIKYAVDKSA
ncbi:class I SAM-dependent methyltransferase [Candidatus Latescibacterota bacterium]